METSLTSLLKGFLKYVIRKAVHLDIHLSGGDTVFCSGYLEVHVTKMVLISEDIRKDGIAVIRACLICNKTHGHTGNRFLNLHTCIHKRKAAAAH